MLQLRPVNPRSLFELEDGVQHDSSDAAALCCFKDLPRVQNKDNLHWEAE